MQRTVIFLIGFVCLSIIACRENGPRPDGEVEIPDFNFPETVVFEQNLSAYNIFEGTPANLSPSDDFHIIQLSSILFTDYAKKQRLLKVPAGTQMTRLTDGSIDFPDGTILTKTFYYFNDERDPSLGKRIIETRLEIKESDTWNIATYLWNQDQTDATLALDGLDTQVSWVSGDGNNLSTLYHVPSHNECMTCHQAQSRMTPLGPTLRNMNRIVGRGGASLNQLDHLQAIGVLNDFDVSQVSHMVDYNDLTVSLEERGRAYLAMNCAHCHNPDAWEATEERDFDFRYETPLDQSGILFDEGKIVESLMDREMPFIGTTILDQEGVDLIIEFMGSL